MAKKKKHELDDIIRELELPKKLSEAELNKQIQQYRKSPEWVDKSSGKTEVTMAPWEYAMAMPEDAIAGAVMKVGSKLINPLVKYAGKKVIPNIYKANPLAEKLIDKKASFRVVGSDAYDDFLESGLVRSGRGTPKKMNIGGVEETIYRPTPFPSFQKGYADTSYAPEGMESYVFKTKVPTFARGEANPVTGHKIRGSHYAHRPIDTNTGNVITELPAKDVEVFSATPHWLKGYPKIKEDGGNLMFMGGLTGATAISGGGEVAGQLSGMINPNTKGGGAASGALKGASMGSALGPYGMAAGAVIGGVAGFIGAENAQNKQSFSDSINSMKERNNMLGIKANGGYILPLGVNPNQSDIYEGGGDLTEFNNGGTHAQNPYQGIPQGVDQDGQQNKVEQGETKYNDYIFSNQLMLDKNTVMEHNLPKSLEGKSFADASKKLSKLIKERPNDPISKATHKDYMKSLMMANDRTRQIEESNTMAMGGNLFKLGGPDGGDLLYSNRPSYYENESDSDYNKRAQREINAYGVKVDVDGIWGPKTEKAFGEYENIKNSLASKAHYWNPKQIDRIGSKGVSSSGFKSQPQKLESQKLINNSNTLKSSIQEDSSFFNDPKSLRYAPIAFDALAGAGLFGKSPSPEQYNPTLIQQQGNLNPNQIDEMQMRNAVDSAYQTGVSGMAEASGGSGASLRAGLSGLNADYMSSIGKSYADVNKSNISTKMAADQFNLGMNANVASQNAQFANQAGMYNNQLSNQSKTKRYEDSLSYLAKGAEGLGDIGYEERMREIMPRIYGYDDYGRYVTPLNKKCGGRLRLKNHKK